MKRGTNGKGLAIYHPSPLFSLLFIFFLRQDWEIFHAITKPTRQDSYIHRAAIKRGEIVIVAIADFHTLEVAVGAGPAKFDDLTHTT
jgi:hypothetical protein